VSGYGHRAETWTTRRWPAIRAKGRTHFILVRGVLAWGGMMFIAGLVAVWLMHAPSTRALSGYVAIAALLCVLGGLLWGAVTWHLNEKIFRSLPSSQSIPQR